MATELGIKITADSGQATQEINQLTDSLHKTEQATQAAASSQAVWGEFATHINQAMQAAGQIAGYADSFVDFSRKVIDLSDSYRSLEARISVAVGSSEKAKAVMSQISDIALRTHAPLEGTAELFARLANATKDVGTSSQDLLRFTEGVSNAMRLTGVSSQEAHGALIQLSQAMSAGALRGEEFNSVNEQMPPILDAVAKSLSVTKGELKALAADGKLSTQVIMDAVLLMGDKWADQAKGLPVTLNQAIQDMETAWQRYLGTSQGVQEASQTLAKVFTEINSAAIGVSQSGLSLQQTLGGGLLIAVAQLASATGGWVKSMRVAQAQQVSNIETAAIEKTAALESLEIKAQQSALEVTLARTRMESAEAALVAARGTYSELEATTAAVAAKRGYIEASIAAAAAAKALTAAQEGQATAAIASSGALGKLGGILGNVYVQIAALIGIELGPWLYQQSTWLQKTGAGFEAMARAAANSAGVFKDIVTGQWSNLNKRMQEFDAIATDTVSLWKAIDDDAKKAANSTGQYSGKLTEQQKIQIQLNTAMAQQGLLLSKITESMDKQGKAAESTKKSQLEEIDARKNLANLLPNEIEKRNALLSIAAEEVGASQKFSDEKRNEATIIGAATETLIAKTNARIAAGKELSKEEKKALQDSIDKAAKYRDEAVAAEAATEKLKQNYLQLQIQADVARDNSDRVRELAAAYAEARDRLSQLTPGTKEYNAALERTTYAQSVYIDSLNDTVARESAHIGAIKAKNEARLAGAQAEIQNRNTAYQLGGVTASLAERENDAIRIIKLKSAARLEELAATQQKLQADLDVANSELQEAQATGQATQAIQYKIDKIKELMQLTSIQSKQSEAQSKNEIDQTNAVSVARSRVIDNNEQIIQQKGTEDDWNKQLAESSAEWEKTQVHAGETMISIGKVLRDQWEQNGLSVEYFDAQLSKLPPSARAGWQALHDLEEQMKSMQKVHKDSGRRIDEFAEKVKKGSVSTQELAGWARQAETAENAMAWAAADAARATTSLAGPAHSSGMALQNMARISKEDLVKLKSAIDEAKNALKEMEDQAKSALQSAQDELDNMKNNKVAIEERRYKALQEELKAKLEAAQKANDAKAVADIQEAMRIQQEIHDRKMKQIKDEQQAQLQASTDVRDHQIAVDNTVTDNRLKQAVIVKTVALTNIDEVAEHQISSDIAEHNHKLNLIAKERRARFSNQNGVGPAIANPGLSPQEIDAIHKKAEQQQQLEQSAFDAAQKTKLEKLKAASEAQQQAEDALQKKAASEEFDRQKMLAEARAKFAESERQMREAIAKQQAEADAKALADNQAAHDADIRWQVDNTARGIADIEAIKQAAEAAKKAVTGSTSRQEDDRVKTTSTTLSTSDTAIGVSGITQATDISAIVSAFHAIAARPISVQVNGREIASSVVNELKTIQRTM